MSTRPVPKKRKAAAAKQAAGWTCMDFAAWTRDLLGGLTVLWYEARFAGQNGYPRPVRGLRAEFERRLAARMMELLKHPLRRPFDRRSGFEDVVEELLNLDAAVREHVNAEFTLREGHETVERGGYRCVLGARAA